VKKALLTLFLPLFLLPNVALPADADATRTSCSYTRTDSQGNTTTHSAPDGTEKEFADGYRKKCISGDWIRIRG
jgi:hypothetical protein